VKMPGMRLAEVAIVVPPAAVNTCRNNECMYQRPFVRPQREQLETAYRRCWHRCTQEERQRLRAWLLKCKVTEIVMEPTGAVLAAGLEHPGGSDELKGSFMGRAISANHAECFS
jgi:hypothetical protein